MTFSEKVVQLSQRINDTLPQIIGRKCVFLDLAYYVNIGDVLIWEGTEWFLKLNNIKCIYKASKDTFDWRPIPRDTTIVLQGGGNFGDVWLPHQEFRLKVIAHYPNNKIVILPQTVFYEDKKVMEEQAKVFAQHDDLTICARDKITEKLLNENFSNKVICLPDMAFCIPSKRLTSHVARSEGKNLFLKRGDKELSNFDYSQYIQQEVDIHDWPSYEGVSITLAIYKKIFARRGRLYKLHLMWLVDLYAQKILRPHFVNTGIEFLSKYNYIYTTRLHVAILSALLGKPFTFFDNSYGKNKSFFETWLNDVPEINFIYG